MTDCKGYSSLFDLVESHISNLNLQETRSDDNVLNSVPMSPASEIASGVSLMTLDQKFPIPKLSTTESPLAKVLANQINNMLLAKERRLQEEQKQKEAKEKSEEDNFVIDLMQALQTPGNMNSQLAPKSISSSSSCESLFEMRFKEHDEEMKRKRSQPLLPCITDMAYILGLKIPKSRCSTFGKVLISRQRPVAGIYWHEKFGTSVEAFKFDIPSPCDAVKPKVWKPTMSCSMTKEDYLLI